MGRCHYCRNALPVAVQQKNRLCPSCGSDIHACRNCVHFDDSLSTKCREPDSPWVLDRNTTNTCPFFELQGAVAGPDPDDGKKLEAERAKEAFRALFRNP